VSRSTQGNNTIGSSKNNNSKHQTCKYKSKRKISKREEGEQSYKFKEDPVVERVAFEIEARGDNAIREEQKK